MKNINLLSPFIVLCLSVIASASSSAKELPIQMSGGMTFSAFDDQMGETEALGYKASLGYSINENVLFELGYADFSAFSKPEIDSLRSVMIETDLMLPLSDYASLYAGGGGALSSDDTNLTASIGLKYQLSQNWYADVGYQGIFDLVRQKDDLYAFNALLVYRFSSSESNEKISTSESRPNLNLLVEKPAKELVPEAQLASVAPTLQETPCHQKLTEYRVASGDNLYHLARKFNISIKELLELNNKFKSRDQNLIYPGEKIVYPKLSCLN